MSAACVPVSGDVGECDWRARNTGARKIRGKENEPRNTPRRYAFPKEVAQPSLLFPLKWGDRTGGSADTAHHRFIPSGARPPPLHHSALTFSAGRDEGSRHHLSSPASGQTRFSWAGTVLLYRLFFCLGDTYPDTGEYRVGAIIGGGEGVRWPPVRLHTVSGFPAIAHCEMLLVELPAHPSRFVTVKQGEGWSFCRQIITLYRRFFRDSFHASA